MEIETTFSDEDTIKRLRKLLWSFDKYSNSADLYSLYIRKKLKKVKTT